MSNFIYQERGFEAPSLYGDEKRFKVLLVNSNYSLSMHDFLIRSSVGMVYTPLDRKPFD